MCVYFQGFTPEADAAQQRYQRATASAAKGVQQAKGPRAWLLRYVFAPGIPRRATARRAHMDEPGPRGADPRFRGQHGAGAARKGSATRADGDAAHG